ncbi:MAG: hypothetical protein IID44_08715 [Planctomycetes bacterium]|nr:hypothetical protein [Planctomycetota bacterium]
MMQSLFVNLRCPNCCCSTQCGGGEISSRLLAGGKLRRGSQPEWEILVELFYAVMALRQRTTGGLTRYQMVCPDCRR